MRTIVLLSWLFLTVPLAVRADEEKSKLMSVDFVNTDVRAAFRLIAEATNTNIVVAPDVAGQVTLKATDVPWRQLVDLIANHEGLRATQQGKVLLIVPLGTR